MQQRFLYTASDSPPLTLIEWSLQIGTVARCPSCSGLFHAKCIRGSKRSKWWVDEADMFVCPQVGVLVSVALEPARLPAFHFLFQGLWHFVLSTIKRWRPTGHRSIFFNPKKLFPSPSLFVFRLLYSNSTFAAPFAVVRPSRFFQCNAVAPMSDVMGE